MGKELGFAFGEKRAAASEFWTVFKTPFLSFLSALGWYVGIVSAFNLGSDESNLLLLTLGFVAFFVSVASLVCFSIYKVKQSHVSQRVTLHKTARIEVWESGYAEALEQTRKRILREGGRLDGLVCVCGFYSCGSFEHITEGSALEALMELAASRESNGDYVMGSYRDSESFRQIERSVKQAAEEELKRIKLIGGEGKKKRDLPFGTCIVVDFPYRIEGEAEDSCLGKLLLVVNSEHSSTAATRLSDQHDLIGPSSIDVIPNVFEHVDKLHATTLIMPALGTYRLGNTSQTVIAEIVSRYLASLQRSQRPYDLVMTLHKRDLDASGIGLMQVRKYIRNAASLLSS